ncbi:MAG: hypothetical protein J6S85_00125 [Methanobrevibacter sp.]|nr:hypothetical protein [Methanobrevibacter sp.]
MAKNKNLAAMKAAQLIMKKAKAFDILKKYIKIEELEDDFFYYSISDKQYVSNRSSLLMSHEEYESIKDLL